MPDAKFKETLKKAIELIAVLDEEEIKPGSQSDLVPVVNNEIDLVQPEPVISEVATRAGRNEVEAFRLRIQGVTHLDFKRGQMTGPSKGRRSRVAESKLLEGIGMDPANNTGLSAVYIMAEPTKAIVAFTCIPSRIQRDGSDRLVVSADQVEKFISNMVGVATGHGRDVVLMIAAFDGFDGQALRTVMEHNGLNETRWSVHYALIDLAPGGGVYCNPMDKVSNKVLLSCGIPSGEENSIKRKSEELGTFLEEQEGFSEITLHAAMTTFLWSWRDTYMVFWDLENSSRYGVGYETGPQGEATLKLYRN